MPTNGSMHWNCDDAAATPQQSALRHSWPNLRADQRYRQPLPQSEDYIVDFDGSNDLLCAKNWPMFKKYANLLACSQRESARVNIMQTVHWGHLGLFRSQYFCSKQYLRPSGWRCF